MPYNEIRKLNHKLNEMGIEHEFRKNFDGYQIIVRKTNSRVSIIEYHGSYGGTKDLLEAYDFVGDPKGYLTCDEAIDYLAYRGFVSKK